MTVGTELKLARERAGLSPEEISERTKIQLYKIDALEHGDFELLPQGIYLDGIVRAYAQQVAIDPEQMVERARLERGKLPGDWEIPFATPIDLHGVSTSHNVQTMSVPEGHDSLNSFAAEKDVAAVPIARQATHAPLARQVPSILHAPPSAHVPYVAHAPARPARGRARLALPVLALLAAIGWGAYLYESSRPLGLDVTAVSAPPPASPTELATTGTGAAPREARPNDLPATAPAPDTAAPPARPVSTATPPVSASPSRPVESPAQSAAAPQPQSIGTSGSAARSVPNVSGSWSMATHVESSSDSPLAGQKLGYEVKLEQDGDRVTGVGRKVSENGSGIVSRAQTPVTVSGSITGDRLTLNFVERRGAERPTQGKFVLLIDEGGTLRGRFSNNAARSSGRVEARRVPTR
jgi:cytoskeletal protein RodZ